MPKSKNTVALAAALVLVCAVVAYEWYLNVGKRGANAPVAAITAAPSPVESARPPLPSASPSPKPEVFVVSQRRAQTTASGSAVVTQPTTVPLAGTSTTIPELPSKQTGSAYVAAAAPIIVAPDGAPRIVSMSISTPVVHSGQTVSGSVETSTNVASVEARIGGYSSSLRKVGAGRFSLNYRVPFVPFFMKKTYDVQIIARNTRGDAVSTTFPITVR